MWDCRALIKNIYITIIKRESYLLTGSEGTFFVFSVKIWIFLFFLQFFFHLNHEFYIIYVRFKRNSMDGIYLLVLYLITINYLLTANEQKGRDYWVTDSHCFTKHVFLVPLKNWEWVGKVLMTIKEFIEGWKSARVIFYDIKISDKRK